MTKTLDRIGAGCLILGPVSFAAAEFLFPGDDGTSADMLDGMTAARGLLAAAITVSFASIVFLIPAFFTLGARPVNRGGALIRSGVAVAYLALLLNAVLLGVNVVFWQLADPATGRDVAVGGIDAVTGSPAAPVLISCHYLLVLGTLLLGAGLWRAGFGPRWAAAFVALCGVVDAVFGSFGDTADLIGGIVSDVMLIAGLCAYAWLLLREAHGPRSEVGSEGREWTGVDDGAPVV